MKNDFAKRNDREDVSPFLSVFLYCPAILFICECACVCVVRTYSRPYGRRLITAWTSPSPLPLQILGLNAEAKKRRRRRKTLDIQTKKENLLNSAIVCFVSTYAKITTLSCLLTMMILPKQYL